MDSPQNRYSENIKSCTQVLYRVERRIYRVGSIRLLTAVSAIVLSLIFKHEEWSIIIGIVVVHLMLFLWLLKISNKLSYKKEYIRHLLKINKDELAGLNYDYSAFDGYPERIDVQHPFTFDLDIFGEKSVFQSINRTQTAFGKNRLADWFENPLTDKIKISERNEAVKELLTQPDFCQHFAAVGKMHPGNLSDVEKLKKFAFAKDFITGKCWKIVSWVLPISWLAGFISAGFGVVGYSQILLFFFVCLGLSYCMTKKINGLRKTIGNNVNVLSTYSSLLKIVEEHAFSSEILQRTGQKLFGASTRASSEIKKLSDYLHAIELGRTFPGGLLLNVFFLWEIKYARAIERLKNEHKHNIGTWFEVLGIFDAFCSLGIFAFNRPQFIFPEISDDYFCYRAKNMGHLLLRDEVCVKNDLDIRQSPHFLIVTGANMAGKSTYLRTVGLNLLLGCMGMPVYAEEMCFYPARPVCSLRTSDSLVNNESYFFAELKRLSGMIERLKNGEKLFIILDEILKGTNSLDKQKGSLALVKQFLSLKSYGIIATHDLELGKLEETFPQEIRNICFEADIRDNNLYFTYKARPGMVQNMNACFLMKQIGIDVDE